MIPFVTRVLASALVAATAAAQSQEYFKALPHYIDFVGSYDAQTPPRPFEVSFDLDGKRVVISLREGKVDSVTLDDEQVDGDQVIHQGHRTEIRDQQGTPICDISTTGLGASVSFYPTANTAYLGVDLQPLSQALQQHLELESGESAHVVGVRPKSPAKTAGLQENDIILACDGHKFSTKDQLRQLMKDRRPGDKISLVVLRKGKPVSLEVNLGRTPQSSVSYSTALGLSGQLPKGDLGRQMINWKLQPGFSANLPSAVTKPTPSKASEIEDLERRLERIESLLESLSKNSKDDPRDS